MKPLVRDITVTQGFFSAVSFAKIGQYLAPLIIAAMDYLVIIGALFTATYVREQVFSLETFELKLSYICFVIPTTYLLFFTYEGLYTKRLPFWKSAELLFKLCAYVNILVIVITFFSDRYGNMPRMLIALSWMLTFLYLIVSRYLIKRFLAYCRLWEKPIIIIGAGKTAEILAENFAKEPQLGYKIVGLIEDQHSDRPLIYKYPHLGSFAQAKQIVKDSNVQDVIVAVPGMERDRLVELIYRIQPYVRNLTVVPDLFGIPLSNMVVETLYNERTVMLKVQNNLMMLRNRFFKRLFDVIVGLGMFFFAMPLLGIIALLIKLDSAGPAFYIAKRLGKGGEEFYCFKFRTMFVNGNDMLATYLADNAEAKTEWERFAKLKNYDPRVTKVGKWLRRYSLDELPQILNVLWGNMSLVGPRPYLPSERERMGYMAHTILETVPGITGLWQVNGRSEIDFAGRLHLDSWYVRNWSLWHDIVLLLKTVKVVVNRKGAY